MTIAVGAVVAVFYFIALVGIVRRQKWGAIMAGATALFDLAVGFFLSATVLYSLAGAVLLAVGNSCVSRVPTPEHRAVVSVKSSERDAST